MKLEPYSRKELLSRLDGIVKANPFTQVPQLYLDEITATGQEEANAIVAELARDDAEPIDPP